MKTLSTITGKLHYVLVLFFLFNEAVGQRTLDVMTLTGRYGLPGSYQTTYPGEATESGLMLDMKYGMSINADSNLFWISNLNYFHYQLHSSEILPEALADPMILHGFIFRTGLKKSFGDRSVQLLFAPRYMTDFKGADANVWQMGGLGVYERTFSDRLTLGYGLLFNEELFGPLFTPLVSLYYQWSDRWSVFGLLPIYSKVRFLVNDNLDLGFAHFGFITTYRLGDEDYMNDYVERNTIELYLFARQRIRGDFFMEGRLGYTMSRIYGQYEQDETMDLKLMVLSFGDDREQKNVDFNKGMIGELRLVYSIGR
jgi:hypothetical protein